MTIVIAEHIVGSARDFHGLLGSSVEVIGPWDLPVSDWKGPALKVNLHLQEANVPEGASHIELYFETRRRAEVEAFLGKEVIVHCEVLGEETRGYIGNPPIVKKPLAIGIDIRAFNR